MHSQQPFFHDSKIRWREQNLLSSPLRDHMKSVERIEQYFVETSKERSAEDEGDRNAKSPGGASSSQLAVPQITVSRKRAAEAEGAKDKDAWKNIPAGDTMDESLREDRKRAAGKQHPPEEDRIGKRSNLEDRDNVMQALENMELGT